MSPVAQVVERVTFPAGGLRLYAHQQELWDARRLHGHTRRIANVHRQGGKDVIGLVDLLDDAIHHPGIYAFVGPTRQMVENIVWHGVRESDGEPYLSILPPELILDRNEADLALEIATTQPGKHSRILFLSGNEPMRLRGLPFKAIVFTEYAQFPDSEALDTVLPSLNKSGGGLLILSTPLGLNHYHQLWKMAESSPEWWTMTRTIHDTTDHEGRPLIDPGVIERELAQGQRAEWLAQEYEAKFVVGLIASIFGDVLTQAEQSGRILDLPERRDRACVVALDLGLNDNMVALWMQEDGPWFDVVDVEAWQNLTLQAVVQRIQSKGYPVRLWLMPHDVGQRDLTAAGVGGVAETRKKKVERECGITIHTVEKHLANLSEGLDAVRAIFSRFRFDRRRCAKLLEALSQYRRSWDPRNKVYSDKPLHDWCSDYADALRCFAVGHRPPKKPKPPGWKPSRPRVSASIEQSWRGDL